MKNKIICIILACIVLISFSAIQVSADSFLPPEPFEILSDDGSMVFRWIPSADYRTAQAGVYRSGELVWSVENLPTMGVSVSNFFFSQDFQHMIFIPTTHDFQSMIMREESTIVALEFYTNGELMKTHYISDIVRDMSRVQRSVTMAFWRTAFPETRTMADHIVEHDILRIMTVERIIFDFCLTTGEILGYIYYDTPLVEIDITVKIKGNEIEFYGQPILSQNERVLVPIRNVFETMGFTVEWHENIQEVFIWDRDETFYIAIRMGAPSFLVVTPTDLGYSRADVHRLDVPAQIVGGRIMLPLRALLESVGYRLDWDSAMNTIKIYSSAIEN